MFDFFRRRTAKDYKQIAEDTYKIAKPVKSPREHYRVGFTDDGSTTLTIMGGDGHTMTLTMNRDACEHMIGMLRSTYDQSVEDNA
jgi:hypothetical protein